MADFQGARPLPGLSSPPAPPSHPRRGGDGGRLVEEQGNFETTGDTSAYRYWREWRIRAGRVTDLWDGVGGGEDGSTTRYQVEWVGCCFS